MTKAGERRLHLWNRTGEQNAVLEQAIKVQTGSRLYLYSFFNFGARWEWRVSTTPRLLYCRERELVPIVQEAGWAPGQVWADAENLASAGI
jgi:hypothetical protein